ncbi:hypothetical protein CAEBREN_06181 [Caenorhabditis brenneri]|uniref:SPK domain-containing protein n=1 Tax=Caenorhabditis brenneri TaxID=135651 RepID=G0P3H2_CAEBE|nr:hypothetical protein CAEBREN_06181 [Caenorhabditis brenneri]
MRPSNSKDPKLMKFLIEKTKDAKSPLNISRLAEEFKKNSGSSKSDECWRKRVQKFRSEIQQMDSIDTEVKVKIVFGLSAPVDRIFLNELQKDALVEVDENNRITKFKANDGSLELEGDHSQPAKKMLETIDDKWKSDPEYIELTKFLIEKTKDANSPLSIRQVAEEFKKTSGSSQSVDCLRKRAKRFRSKIHKMYSIDKETTVKLLFALSASTDKDVLNELQKDALVEVDENNRITKFKANDGSLELEGDHSQPAKSISVEKVASALQTTLAVIEF